MKHGIGLVMCCIVLTGCGKARPVTGGTEGRLRSGGQLVSDIEVTIHEADGVSFRPLGFGVTNSEGVFELVQNRAAGPLQLSPGDYRCTLDSAGAPVNIPPEYKSAETTPLKISSSDNVAEIALDAPEVTLIP